MIEFAVKHTFITSILFLQNSVTSIIGGGTVTFVPDKHLCYTYVHNIMA